MGLALPGSKGTAITSVSPVTGPVVAGEVEVDGSGSEPVQASSNRVIWSVLIIKVK